MSSQIFDELQMTNPKRIIQKNNDLIEEFGKSFLIVARIFDCAQEFLSDYFLKVETEFKFPIPVKEIAQKCDFLIYEEELANVDKMEMDNNGGRTTIARMQMRERRMSLDSDQGKIAGTITIDKNLSEYAKRFAVAHELGHYVLRTRNPIGPLFMEDSCPGPFAYAPDKEFLANEFAYALLLPYELVSKKKKEYEDQNQYNPVNYIDWITALKDAAQMPEHYAILGYEEYKKYHFYLERKKEQQQ